MQVQELLAILVAADQSYKEALALAQDQGAEMFKTIRAERNMTQRALADALQIDFTTVSKIENGHIRPGKPVLRRLAAWLKEQPVG